MKAITQAGELFKIYHELDEKLFDGKLGSDIQVKVAPLRKTNISFVHHKWNGVGHPPDSEILINEKLLVEPKETWLAMLVHGMIHFWQYKYGESKPPKHKHNKEFRLKAETLGLIIPDEYSSEQEITQDGKFMEVSKNIDVTSIDIPSDYAYQLEEKPKTKLVTYTCPQCSTSIKSKPGIISICGNCIGDIPDWLQPFIMKPEE
ncbi:SprT-like domain-containing protein [Scytonema sp. NUACC26]|uniref:SprT-like domain-containing protein n=1 Tax=Scytonema sp. NUACC26 TaxID=3140176 RepID=UPI0034DCA07B